MTDNVIIRKQKFESNIIQQINALKNGREFIHNRGMYDFENEFLNKYRVYFQEEYLTDYNERQRHRIDAIIIELKWAITSIALFSQNISPDEVVHRLTNNLSEVQKLK